MANADALTELRSVAVDNVIVSTDVQTRLQRFLRTASGAPLIADFPQLDAQQRALNFLSDFGSLVGIASPLSELQPLQIVTDSLGLTHVKFAQHHQGIPVFGGEVLVHMSNAGILAVSAGVVDQLSSLATTPTLPRVQAEQIALNDARKATRLAELRISDSHLSYYDHGLFSLSQRVPRLTWQVTTRGEHSKRVHWIDARTGVLINAMENMHSALYRKIYTPAYNPEFEDRFLIREEGDPPLAPVIAGIGTPIDKLYDFAGHTYDFYYKAFGRDSYDDAGAVMHSVYLINAQCPNAYWDGSSTNYCPLFDADDVVSHEWGHAVTQHMDNLVYQYQSGALNESYSDIFGETVDLHNDADSVLGGFNNETTYDEGGVRWVVGEDLTKVLAALLLRDMWDPDNFPSPSPGKVTSENYFCGSGDGGGVHTNSGVPNHAYAMLVDGKEYNGVTIQGIGFAKASSIYYHAKNFQTRTTNFADHADALEAACAALIGQPIFDPLGEPADPVTAADCVEVAHAIEAVELRTYPAQCNYQPLLQPENGTPALCDEGEALSSYHEDFADGRLPQGWDLESNGVTADWPDYQWEVVSSDAFPLPRENSNGHAAFALNDIGGTCTAGGDISGSFALISPEISVKDASKVAFTHYVATEFEFDGGNLLISVNGSEFNVVDEPSITFNGYNATLATSADGNTNPKAGENAWTGSDEGEATSQWGTTLVDLSGLASTGDMVRLKWELGVDGCNGNDGWYIDEVDVYSCTADGADSGVIPSRGSDITRGGALGHMLLLMLCLGLFRRRHG